MKNSKIHEILDNMANKWIKTQKKIQEENYEDKPSNMSNLVFKSFYK